MKKIIAFFFACGFALAVVSCGQKSETGTSESVDTTSTVSEPAPVVSEETTSVAADTTAVQ